MNIKIKQIVKKISAAVFGFALIGQTFAADAVLAASPVFTPDLATLRVANKTDGDTTWHSSVTADPGEKVAFDIYYRNSTEGTVAKNTKVKIVFPTSAQSIITPTGSISADNASTISGTATINLGSQTAKLTFGSLALWYPNKNTQTPTQVLISQGAGTVEVDIGNIQGECEDQGHVMFFATLSEVADPGITITKTVRNITDGQSSYSSWVNADPSDRIAFKIVIASNGETAANNVVVSDNLPSGLIYQDALSVSKGYTGSIASGINLGTINANNSVTITFEADVQSASYFGSSATLVNKAYATATGVSQKQASATVYVAKQVVNNPSLTITKTVRNITDGQSYYSNSVNADPNDRIGFKIVVTSNGETAANNVHVSDSLPSGLIYGDSLSVSSGYSSGDITSGINLGTINANNSVTITFEADVQSASYFGNSVTLTNYAYASATNVSQRQASATVYVSNAVVNNPNLTITKTVRNITDGQSYYSNSVNADPGERVSFKIEVSSSGQTAASNVRVSDSLPAGLIYRDNVSVSSGYSSGDITSGINLGTLYVGNIITITFEADVQSASYFGNSVTLTNYAYASATNVSQRQASATVYVANNMTPVQTSNFTVNKMARNISKGETGWQNSIQADPGDQVEFYINVTNTGNTAANGLYVLDPMPVKMTYIGNVRMDGYANSGNIVSGSGIYLGDLSANQSRVVIFQAQVFGEANFNFGSTKLINIATVRNTANSVIDSAVVVVNKRAVAGAETEVNTGLKEDLMSYLLLPALLAIVLMIALRSQLFKVDKWLAIRGADNRAYRSQRMLDQKINQIREKENRK
ncbi:MAG: hypothetical protein WC926_01360 [Candidatus Paceibacterota bacterium]|jgi:uncharacterized repeat protein (TIGR01451 family)